MNDHSSPLFCLLLYTLESLNTAAPPPNTGAAIAQPPSSFIWWLCGEEVSVLLIYSFLFAALRCKPQAATKKGKIGQVPPLNPSFPELWRMRHGQRISSRLFIFFFTVQCDEYHLCEHIHAHISNCRQALCSSIAPFIYWHPTHIHTHIQSIYLSITKGISGIDISTVHLFFQVGLANDRHPHIYLYRFIILSSLVTLSPCQTV